MKKWKRAIIQLALVVVIVVVAIGAAKMMSSFRKPPEKKAQNVSAPLLNAIQVYPETLQMTVQGFGTVKPRMEVQVVPQVSGKVIQCHRQLVNGGFFQADEPLVMIEQTDYTLAVESADAAVAQAEVKVEQEKAEADVAHQEWEKLHPGKQPDSVLVFREPQIRNAQAQLNAAKARLAKAKLDLERTTMTMPFDGRIVQTNIDVGQFITAGVPVATVYRTDIVEIMVPLEDAELQWFKLSLNGNHNGDSGGTPVSVFASFGGGEHTWAGQLVRTEGYIDPKSRLVHAVAQVVDPFKIESPRPPLTPGMFVRVDIQGRQFENIYRLPRYAIRRGSEVWVATGTGETKKLTIQPVGIFRIDRDFAYVVTGLDEGDFVITSALETVTNGMTVRIHVDDEAKNQ
ncbi:MAG: efflux RND transporter periplasmic adaptor subunit [Planctomycetes bacterium]|nr:efflux RND transporter periplasmic adaptor subunit [Planctomycetota bacterium]